LRDALGRLELRGRLVPGPVRGLEEAGPVDHVRAEPHVAHHLDAARDPDVDRARRHERAHQVVGLLARAALRVDAGAARRVAATGGEPGVARHVVRLLARLGHAAADHLLDVARIDAGLLAQPHLDLGEQLHRVQARQVALSHLAARDRRAERLDDDGFAHARVSFARQSCPRIMALVGTPTPAVTRTWSFFAGWLTEVPRISRTPSFTPFMPWMYASLS